MSKTLTHVMYLALSPGTKKPLLVRTLEKPPLKASAELIVKLEIALPLALFEKPVLTARVEVGGDVGSPTIDVKMQDKLGQALSQQLGQQVVVKIEAPKPSWWEEKHG